jgi:caa(3)-type oxidase subunit IV
MTDQGTGTVEESGGDLVRADEAERGDVVLAGEHTVPVIVRSHEHPQPRQYVIVAVVLCILTGIEVGCYYLEGDVNSNLLIAMLAVLAFVKFFLVCSWYMHMRMDAPFFRRTFIVGIALATAVYGVVLATFASTVLST